MSENPASKIEEKNPEKETSISEETVSMPQVQSLKKIQLVN